MVRFNSESPITPPAAAGGTDNIIIKGYLKLSNSIVINKYTIAIETNRFIAIAFQVIVSSSAVPEISILISDDHFYLLGYVGNLLIFQPHLY